MTPERLIKTGIAPALSELEVQGIKDSPDARRFMLAIALQESSLRYRRQVLAGGAQTGPAASWYQFEKGGGCTGVLTHRAVADRMKKICADYNIDPTPQGLWEGMRFNDVVASAAARLLIYTLPKSLPTTSQDGWEQYISGWRPGKPHYSAWEANWRTASMVVGVKP